MLAIILIADLSFDGSAVRSCSPWALRVGSLVLKNSDSATRFSSLEGTSFYHDSMAAVIAATPRGLPWLQLRRDAITTRQLMSIKLWDCFSSRLPPVAWGRQ